MVEGHRRPGGMAEMLGTPEASGLRKERVQSCPAPARALAWTPHPCSAAKRSPVTPSLPATPQGQRLSPHLRRLLVSGLLSVKVVRADDLGVSGLLGRPTV